MTELPDPEIVLAIDPGRAKCGVAVVSGPAPLTRHCKAVVETERLVVEVAETLRRFPDIARFLVGGGTGGASLRRALRAAFPEMPIEIVDEHGSSERARRRFVAEVPPLGWRRFLPTGLRAPELPYDDYVALLLAEEYFLGNSGTRVE